MKMRNKSGAFILGLFIFCGLFSVGFFMKTALLEYKFAERTVVVKGLSEREYPADSVVWPIQFTTTSNQLTELYDQIEADTAKLIDFMVLHGIPKQDVFVSPPSITDKMAFQYSNGQSPEFRYSAIQTVTIHTEQIEKTLALMGEMSVLGKQGIAFTGSSYQWQTEFLFTRLNEVKPSMVEEATRNAREVAEKFAMDSDSKLGKIKKASQGQFAITPRDRNNPQIKKVRVVSTVEYYLSD